MIGSGSGEWLVSDKHAKRPLNVCVQRLSHHDDAAERGEQTEFSKIITAAQVKFVE